MDLKSLGRIVVVAVAFFQCAFCALDLSEDLEPEEYRYFVANGKNYLVTLHANIYLGTGGQVYCRNKFNGNLARPETIEEVRNIEAKLFDIQQETGYIMGEVGTGLRTSLEYGSHVHMVTDINEAGFHCAVLEAWDHKSEDYGSDLIKVKSRICYVKRTILCESEGLVGCYKDDAHDREFAYMPIWDDETMTIESCVMHCYNQSYDYAGIMAGSECRCANTYGRHGEACYCTSTCSGNEGQICGGAWANTVYLT